MSIVWLSRNWLGIVLNDSVHTLRQLEYIGKFPIPLPWMNQRLAGALIRVLTLIGKTNFFSEPPNSSVLLQMNPQWQKGNREKASRNPSEKSMILLCFCPRITISHGIAVKWFLRVYWLLPLSIVASFKKNRRFFCLESSLLLESTDDSFAEHHEYLGQFNQLHCPKESFPYFNGLFFFSSTEIVDSLAEVILNQQTPANKTLQSFLLTKRSCQTCRTREFCWAIPGYEFAFLDDGHQWNEVSPLASALQERKR